MKKSRTLNIIMAVLVLAVVLSGVIFAGSLRGWFSSKSEEGSACLQDISGSVNIERNGIGFSSSGETPLRDGDIVETRSGSYATVRAGKNSVMFNENTEARIVSASEKGLKLEVMRGEVFVEINEGGSFGGLSVNGEDIISVGTVYSVSVQTGSWNIYVYEGSVEALGKKVGPGESLSAVGDYCGTADLSASALNEFNISRLMSCVSSHKTCFSAADLDKVLSDREEEKRLALEEQAAHDAEVISQGGTVAVQTANTQTVPAGSSQTPAAIRTCTIQIRCDTILDNMDKLTPGKNAYVPANGVILATSSVQFVDGETVFDVLSRVCSYAGIQLEYSWTPMYGSYYIEGINNLYEFDCGAESGWMYKVNGWFPNYGCSSYVLKDGDVIVWCYTCNGLGADVGGSVY
ncbi:MAG: DUF4430 domain-containing protein [Eubacteriales bacterium]|nr:DUF4430 domain-containing protein [Eubacteriales bacterium]